MVTTPDIILGSGLCHGYVYSLRQSALIHSAKPLRCPTGVRRPVGERLPSLAMLSSSYRVLVLLR
jgi:hypothetical protein